MKNADDPTGEDFENLILLREKQRKKIFAIANDANYYKRKCDDLNYEICKRK